MVGAPGSIRFRRSGLPQLWINRATFPRHDQRSLLGIASLLVGYAVPAGRLGRVALFTSCSTRLRTTRTRSSRLGLRTLWQRSREQSATRATMRTRCGCGRLLSVYAGQTACRQPAPVRFGPLARANSKARPRLSTSSFYAHFSVLSCENTHFIFPARFRHRGGSLFREPQPQHAQNDADRQVEEVPGPRTPIAAPAALHPAATRASGAGRRRPRSHRS